MRWGLCGRHTKPLTNDRLNDRDLRNVAKTAPMGRL